MTACGIRLKTMNWGKLTFSKLRSTNDNFSVFTLIWLEVFEDHMPFFLNHTNLKTLNNGGHTKIHHVENFIILRKGNLQR